MWPQSTTTTVVPDGPAVSVTPVSEHVTRVTRIQDAPATAITIVDDGISVTTTMVPDGPATATIGYNPGPEQ